MGADMQTMTVTIPKQLTPDWEAALRAIRALPLDVLWDTGDDLFPLEYWVNESGRLKELEWFPSAEAAFWSLSSAQQSLHHGLGLFRGVVELGWPEEVIDFTAANHRVLFTGGPSWGDPSGDLIGPLIYLAETGVLTAAGFDGFTPYAEVALAQRGYSGDGSSRRRAEFGACAARIMSLVSFVDEPPNGALLGAFDRLIAELDETTEDRARLGALVDFAVGGLLLSRCLRRTSDTVDERDERKAAGELARLADEDDLDLPRRRSASAAVRQLRTEALELRYWLWAVDDPEVQTDEAVRDLVERSGGTLGEAVDVLLTTPIYTAIAAITDLGFDWRDPRLPLPSAEPVVPGPSETRFAPLAQYQSLMLVDEPDWLAAARLARTQLDGLEQIKALDDLEDISTFLSDEPYDRFATIGKVAGQRLLIGSPEYDERPDIAHAIGRLGRAGLLDAAGVIWWSAPDPNFRGPVQSFVPGYGPR